MDAKKQESGEARRRSNALVKRLALRGVDTFVVFKDIKISLDLFGYFLRRWKKERESNLNIKIVNRRISPEKIPHRCYRLARNG